MTKKITRQQRRARERQKAKQAQQCREKASLPPESPPSPLAEHRKSIGERIQNHPLVAVIALLAAMSALAGLAYDAIRPPSIDPEGSDPRSPFGLPFTVVNNSFVFPMKDAIFVCIILQARSAANSRLENMTLTDLASEQTIAPMDIVQFHCKANAGFPRPMITLTTPGDQYVSAHIKIRVIYRTLWFQRATEPIEFTWYTGTDAHWIRGTIAD